jgi:hypothetical protein
MKYLPINLEEKFAKFSQHSSPKPVAQINNYHLKMEYISQFKELRHFKQKKCTRLMATAPISRRGALFARILRLGEKESNEALKQPYTKLFDITGKAMKGWVMVEGQGFKTDDKLKSWLNKTKFL